MAKTRTNQACECGRGSRVYLQEASARALTHSLSRIEGHVGAVKRMVGERRCADELLTQIAAVKSALNTVTLRILEEELGHCLTQCGAEEAEARFGSAMRAVGSMLKH